MVSCPDCAKEVDGRFRLCGYCGAELAPGRPREEVRRRATMVTSDLKGSTSLAERLDPESLREVLTLYFDEMTAVFESHGGTIEKIIGDAIVAVFGFPISHDDDALRAVQATAETQRALATLNERLDRTWGIRLANRTGIATGEVVVGQATAGEHILTGDVVQRSNKLEQSAPVMEALLDESTLLAVAEHAAVEELDPVVPKGATEPVAVYRLVSVAADAPRGGGIDAPSARTDIRLCPSCGEENPAAFRSCGSCGTGLAARARAEDSRKTVTIVFSDLRATGLAGEPLGPEALRNVMALAFDECRRVLERHGGTVEKFIGDAVMAVFGLPVRHEDDALRAVRSAFDMRAALNAMAEELERERRTLLEVAIGVNTGEVVAGDASLGQRLVTGDAVNVAARLEQAAPLREVLIGDLTYRLVRDAVDVEEVEPLVLKGKAEPVPAYRLLAVGSGAAVARRGDAPMVGRENEMALLRSTLRGALVDRGCRMVTVVGDAGVGKTRLTREFLESIRSDARVLNGRCLPYGEGITFWPIVEVAREAAEIREGDPPDAARRRLASLLGQGNEEIANRVGSAIGLIADQFPVSELFWGIRKFLEALAEEEPVVVLFDDIHWAEQTFLDLIGYLTESSQDAPLVLLCTARHELLERHPDWAESPSQARIVLAPLSDANAGLVVENLLGQAGLAENVRARVVAAAEGNPLFVEQLLSMLIDNRALRFADGRWAAATDLSEISIPPTIHALLAARLDQLPRDERSVIGPASVIGLSFAQSAVQELAPDDVREDVPAHLSTLTTKQLVRPGSDGTLDLENYRFRHILVRDAAYQGLLKRSRATYHERFVAWADRVNAESDRATEFEEILGYHLEQAFRYRTELGPLDERGISIGVDAARRLASAGHRAMARGDMPAAANLLQRAAATLPPMDPGRTRLLRDAGEALMELGEFNAADDVLLVAQNEAAARNDPGAETTSAVVRLQLQYMTAAGETETDVVAEVDRAIVLLESIHDDEGLARAWRLLLLTSAAAGRYVLAEKAAERAIEHARRAGDRRIETRIRSMLAGCALLGQTPVGEAIERCELLLLQAEGDRKSEALILQILSHLEAMRGEFGRARELYRRSRADFEELGVRQFSSLVSLDSGWVEMLAGDAVAAERELRGDYETLDAMGERNYISTVAAYLAEAVYRQGRYDEAEALTTFSEEVAAPDDVSTQFMVRCVRGKVLAWRGEQDEAERMAREGVLLIGESDDIRSQGIALMGLAEVLRLGERPEEAAAVATEALRVNERKGNIVAAGQARAFLESLEAGVLAASAVALQGPASIS